MISSRVVAVVALALSVAVAGCRQADGSMPEPTGDTPNRLSDLTRDLLAVARGEEQARQDFADDLRVFVDDDVPEAVPAVDELSRRTSEVVAGRALSDQNAQRLAHHLWTAADARELSERQVETLQNEMHGLLVSLGVPETNAVDVASQVAEVQRVVTNRERRWYEFF